MKKEGCKKEIEVPWSFISAQIPDLLQQMLAPDTLVVHNDSS